MGYLARADPWADLVGVLLLSAISTRTVQNTEHTIVIVIEQLLKTLLSLYSFTFPVWGILGANIACHRTCTCNKIANTLVFTGDYVWSVILNRTGHLYICR